MGDKGGNKRKREKKEVLDCNCSHFFSFFLGEKRKTEKILEVRAQLQPRRGGGWSGRAHCPELGWGEIQSVLLYFSVRDLGRPSNTALAGLGSQQHGSSRCPRVLSPLPDSALSGNDDCSRFEERRFGRGPRTARISAVLLFLTSSRF